MMEVVARNKELSTDSEGTSNSQSQGSVKAMALPWSWHRKLCTRFHSTRFCARSKAATLILVWNFLIATVYEMGRNTGLRMLLSNHAGNSFIATVALFAGFAVLLLFFPLAGFVADNCFGRYKTATLSLKFIWIGLVAFCIGLILLSVISAGRNIQLIIISLYFILAFIPLLLFLIGMCGFQANIIQFGTDQLHDATTVEIVLFIHWYEWTMYLATGLTKLLPRIPCAYHAMPDDCRVIQALCTLFAVLVVLTATLFLGSKKSRWFVIDSGSRNPYKLVYRVLRFAAKNKYPIQRSAFTYCEDELPSRIDFGKSKYGGPFTTEEVEDVKTFFRILGVLAAVGLAFTLEIPAYYVVPFLQFHLQHTFYDSHTQVLFIIKSELLPLILVTVFIPLYVFFIRPCVYQCVPGTLKRLGIGLVFLLLSVVFSLSVDTAEHILHKNINATCMFTQHEESQARDQINQYVLIVQNFFASMAFLFIYIPIFEFICAQSPHSMKGLLIGTAFAIKGLFQLLGVGLIIPFKFWKPHIPSCGFGYYLLNVFVAAVGLVVFTAVARRYKYRQRDEPCNVRRFVEEYYERLP